MACKICKEWEEEAKRHRKACRDLSLKLAAAYEEIENLKGESHEQRNAYAVLRQRSGDV